MILADVRWNLGRDDAQLALRLIARGSGLELERAEAVLRDEGMDALLDDPRLLPALLESRQGMCASFPLFAYVAVRHALRRTGVEDRVLADYCASILLHFGLRDRAARIAESDDETYESLAAMCADVDGPDARRNFLVRQHMANYSLWMAGLYPDFIESRRWRRGGPDLDYYEEMGRLGFRLAADHRLAAEHGLVPLFQLAAERFPALRVALNDVSDTLLFPNRYSPERLMRQVKDGARWVS